MVALVTVARLAWPLLLVLISISASCATPKTSRTPTLMVERDAAVKKSEGAILGEVRDASDGLPLSMVSVQVERDGMVVAHDISDHKGHYRLGPLDEGLYRISAHFAAARVVYEGVVVHKGLATDVNVSIDLRPQGDRSSKVLTEGELGSIEGVVLDEVDGHTFPGTVVSLSADHLEDAMMAIADEQGRFRFRSLRPGVYAISCFYTLIEQGNVELRRGNIVVAPGETTAVQMQMDLKIR